MEQTFKPMSKSEARDYVMRLKFWRDTAKILKKFCAVLPGVIENATTVAAANMLVKRVDQFGDLVDWKVAGDDRSVFFKSREGALDFIKRGITSDLEKAARSIRDEMRNVLPDEMVPEADRRAVDEMATHLNHGNAASLSDRQANADPTLHQTLDGGTDPFGNKRERKGRLDGRPIYNGTVQEKQATRKARIL